MLSIHVKYNVKNFLWHYNLICKNQSNVHAMNFLTFEKNVNVKTLRATKTVVFLDDQKGNL